MRSAGRRASTPRQRRPEAVGGLRRSPTPTTISGARPCCPPVTTTAGCMRGHIAAHRTQHIAPKPPARGPEDEHRRPGAARGQRLHGRPVTRSASTSSPGLLPGRARAAARARADIWCRCRPRWRACAVRRIRTACRYEMMRSGPCATQPHARHSTACSACSSHPRRPRSSAAMIRSPLAIELHLSICRPRHVAQGLRPWPPAQGHGHPGRHVTASDGTLRAAAVTCHGCGAAGRAKGTHDADSGLSNPPGAVSLN